MLQLIQYQKTGALSVEELPDPVLRDGWVLVRNSFSLISSGTEKTSVETAQASLIGKARSRPDLVHQVVDNVKKEGLSSTYKKVQARLDNYKELGYSSAGLIVESGVPDFRSGDRVACAGYAHHAELVLVPKNLVARVPDSVPLDEASFTTVAAIALQGVRQADVGIGEHVAVIGLGLVGLITVQLLKANGCRVAGLDITDMNFEMAKSFGCDLCLPGNQDSVRAVESFTRGHGTDAVIITAATPSNEPVELALQFARKRSSVVVVGAVGMNIPRAPFYEKEVQFRISASYGPGRYDPGYEEKGIDYPVGYVRWTENRNMEAVLDLLDSGRLNVKNLISHRYPIKDAVAAYDLITGKKQEKFTGILIEYPQAGQSEGSRVGKITLELPSGGTTVSGRPVVGFIGAGNFAQSYLLPHLKKESCVLKGVATSTPVNAKSVGKKFGFEYCATNADEILNDGEINTIFIATHHDTHARFVKEAVTRGKHVFVEKPLAITEEQLQEIAEAVRRAPPVLLMTGFNRRFSPVFNDLKEFFADVHEPGVISYRVNVGELSRNHWLSDPAQGGRIVGEACHFIDCMSFLTDSVPVSVFASGPPVERSSIGSVLVTIRFANGSVGTLLYSAAGDSSLGKEYCEVHVAGRSAAMHDFEKTVFYKSRKKTTRHYDGSKGHAEEVRAFVSAVMGKGGTVIPFGSQYATSLATLRIMESLRKGIPVDV